MSLPERGLSLESVLDPDSLACVVDSLPLSALIACRAVSSSWHCMALPQLRLKRCDLREQAVIAAVTGRTSDAIESITACASLACLLSDDLNDEELECLKNSDQERSEALCLQHVSLTTRMKTLAQPTADATFAAMDAKYLVRIESNLADHARRMMRLIGVSSSMAAAHERAPTTGISKGLLRVAKNPRRQSIYLHIQALQLHALWRHGPGTSNPEADDAERNALELKLERTHETLACTAAPLCAADPVVLMAAFSLAAFRCDQGKINEGMEVARRAHAAAMDGLPPCLH